MHLHTGKDVLTHRRNYGSNFHLMVLGIGLPIPLDNLKDKQIPLACQRDRPATPESDAKNGEVVDSIGMR